MLQRSSVRWTLVANRMGSHELHGGIGRVRRNARRGGVPVPRGQSRLLEVTLREGTRGVVADRRFGDIATPIIATPKEANVIQCDDKCSAKVARCRSSYRTCHSVRLIRFERQSD